MKPTLHLDVMLRQTDEGYEAHCLQFDLVKSPRPPKKPSKR